MPAEPGEVLQVHGDDCAAEPVKAILSTPARHSASPVAPKPVTGCSTGCSGTTCANVSTSQVPVPGVYSLGLKTTALPAARVRAAKIARSAQSSRVAGLRRGDTPTASGHRRGDPIAPLVLVCSAKSEGEQDVSGHLGADDAEVGVSGVAVDHPVRDHGTAAVDRSAEAGYAVRRVPVPA